MPVVHIGFSSNPEAEAFAEAVHGGRSAQIPRSVTGISLTHPEIRGRVIARLAALGFISAQGGAGLDVKLDYADWRALLGQLEQASQSAGSREESRS
jgi:hypothetical protein